MNPPCKAMRRLIQAASSTGLQRPAPPQPTAYTGSQRGTRRAARRRRLMRGYRIHPQLIITPILDMPSRALHAYGVIENRGTAPRTPRWIRPEQALWAVASDIDRIGTLCACRL